MYGNRLRMIALASLLGAGVAVYWLAPGATEMEQFQRYLQSMGGWAALVSGLLMVTQAVVAPLPANVISASNGFLFGAFWGTLLSWVTTLVGASLCYYISEDLRATSGDAVCRWSTGTLRTLHVQVWRSSHIRREAAARGAV